MFRLAMSHLQAIRTYCSYQTLIIYEMLARYRIPYSCTMVILIKRILKQSNMVKVSNIKIDKMAE
jgi:hypothetical protein